MISADLQGTGLEGASLGGASLKGAGLDQVAGWAARAALDDAAAVRAVVETFGGRLAAGDVAGVVSQFTGNGAAMQPGHETVVGSQQLKDTYDAALENMRLDFTSCFDSITVQGDFAAVRATSQGTITICATGETQPACLRQLFVLERTEADWKIAQYMYQQMPEQSGGGCSGI